MKQYVLDSNAVLRYLNVSKGEGAEKVHNLFVQAEQGRASLSMSAVNLGEVLYILLKRIDKQKALHYIESLQQAVTIANADATRCIQAATLKHQYKLGYADSFAAALTLELRATLVSADPGFESLGKTFKWIKLPAFDS